MKSKAKIILSMLLVATCIICLVGCGIIQSISVDNDDVKKLNEEFVELIDNIVAHDSAGAYSTLYSNTTDSETFDSVLEQVYEYFPVSGGYTWELLKWDRYRGKNIDDNFINAEYKVAFDDSVYYVAVNWRYNSEESGFTGFQIVNEEDAQDSQNQ